VSDAWRRQRCLHCRRQGFSLRPETVDGCRRDLLEGTSSPANAFSVRQASSVIFGRTDSMRVSSVVLTPCEGKKQQVASFARAFVKHVTRNKILLEFQLAIGFDTTTSSDNESYRALLMVVSRWEKVLPMDRFRTQKIYTPDDRQIGLWPGRPESARCPLPGRGRRQEHRPTRRWTISNS